MEGATKDRTGAGVSREDAIRHRVVIPGGGFGGLSPGDDASPIGRALPDFVIVGAGPTGVERPG